MKVYVFTNGIFNDPEAAAMYAVQMGEAPEGSEVYVVYFPQAANALSELTIAGYRKRP
ncbi:MAG: hypothetical protein LBS70_07545 [Candidatus Accumulibacter sp.]|jgi:hypothetical protein|nr:hypothetical protein [Accumulibacter sp.]